MRNKDHFSALELQNMGALWLDIWINWCLSWLDLDHNLLVFLTNSTAVSFDKPETPDNQFVPLQPNTDLFHLAQAHHRIPPLCCSQAWISVGKKKKKKDATGPMRKRIILRFGTIHALRAYNDLIIVSLYLHLYVLHLPLSYTWFIC